MAASRGFGSSDARPDRPRRVSTPLSVAALDRMPTEQAGALLHECAGTARWTAGMLARRPFVSFARIGTIADEVWATLGPDDWRAAFAHHPRIGASAGAEAQGARGREWSAREQAGLAGSAGEVRAALADANREYERRFGHIYIVCAAGKSAEELLAIARARLTNDPERELVVAAEELRQIMQLRLTRLLAHDAGEGDAA